MKTAIRKVEFTTLMELDETELRVIGHLVGYGHSIIGKTPEQMYADVTHKFPVATIDKVFSSVRSNLERHIKTIDQIRKDYTV